MKRILKPIIIHEWFVRHGGAENVTMAISEIFLEKPIIHSLWNEDRSNQEIEESPLRFLKILPKNFKALFSGFFQKSYWKYGDYLLISSSYLFGHWARLGPWSKIFAVRYIHTPARYIWAPEIDDRFSKSKLTNDFFIKILRRLDRNNTNTDDLYIANSSIVRQRILDSWNVDSEIIHPPVDVDFFNKYANADSPLKLNICSAGRLVRYKNHEFSKKLAAELNCPITIAGAGPEIDNLKKLAERLNVELKLVESPNRESLARILSNTSVFIQPNIEDFGILPLEAMSTGTPVVGLSQGGVRDYVTKQSGLLVHNLNLGMFAAAVIEASKLNRKNVMIDAVNFTKTKFQKTFALAIIRKFPSTASLIKSEFKNR